MGDLSTADPITAVLAWLRRHPRVLAEFGGAEYISGANEAPYPHVRISGGPGGSDLDLRHLIAPEVLVEVYGDQAGQPGDAELRRLLYVVLTACVELGYQTGQPFQPGDPVVTAVVSANNAVASPLAAPAQPRWLAAVQVFLHPSPSG